MRNLARIILLLLLCSPFALKGQIVQPYDILITELMIDPNPVVGLPNFEWVELHNRSDNSIDLEGFLFSSGATRYALPSYQLAPGGYVMVCDDSDVVDLRTFGAAIEISTFPSLTNGGDVARIEDADGNLIHEVIYTKSWYGDTDKDDGGYTLEMINPNDPCLAASNWTASSSPTGATPAAQNSHWQSSTPSAGIQAQEVVTKSASEIEVMFDRIPSMSLNEMDFSISPTVGIIDIVPDNDDGRRYSLLLSQSLNSGQLYTLTISRTVADCAGLSADMEQAFELVLPEAIAEGDLVINEVLFNPIGSASDYVEIYNKSDKFLEIRQLMIGNFKPDGGGSSKEVNEPYILPPMEYLVFTEDTLDLKTRFPEAIKEKILEIDLPSFNNTDGNVTLFTEENGVKTVIDAMDYNEEMHNAFIDDPEGVSLERVAFDLGSDDEMNWHSAASSIGYGSPTLPNSQRRRLDVDTEKMVYLERKTFFPQGQVDNQLVILFELERPDFIVTIEVFDVAGRFIRHLANNQLVGRNDRYYWDGNDRDGLLMNAGVYIIVVQLVAADGNFITKKLPCVLSRRL